MKKNIIKTLFLSFIVAAVISCDENDNDVNIYTGDNFVSFGTTTSVTSPESGDPLTITAYASTSNLTSDFNVEYEITEENVSSGNYTITGGKSFFTFGPNRYSDSIEIVPEDNFTEDGTKIITITLTSAPEGYSIGFPGVDKFNKTFVINLTDDDCALDVNDFTGAPTGTETAGSSVFDTKLTFKDDPDKTNTDTKLYLLMSGNIQQEYMIDAWGESIVESWDIPVEFDITDPDNPKVTFSNNANADTKTYNGVETAVACYTDDGSGGAADWAYGLYITPELVDKAVFSTCDKTFYFEYIWIVNTAGSSTFGDFNSGPFKMAVNLQF